MIAWPDPSSGTGLQADVARGPGGGSELEALAEQMSRRRGPRRRPGGTHGRDPASVSGRGHPARVLGRHRCQAVDPRRGRSWPCCPWRLVAAAEAVGAVVHASLRVARAGAREPRRVCVALAATGGARHATAGRPAIRRRWNDNGPRLVPARCRYTSRSPDGGYRSSGHSLALRSTPPTSCGRVSAEPPVIVVGMHSAPSCSRSC